MQALIVACFMLVSCLAYFSTLKMKATSSTKTLVDFEETTWHFIPEDRTLHNHGCENLKAYIFPVPMVSGVTVSVAFSPFQNVILF
jgi:hypothetical protein